MGKAKTDTANARPMPPDEFGIDWQGPVITPARGLRDWAVKTFIDADAPLFNEDHRHLLWANFECLWAADGFTRQGRTVLGLCEQVTFRISGWPRWRQEQQLREWFDGQIPDYLITIDARYWRDADDTAACALVEHELYHIGQKHDAFGDPEFTQEGMPKLCIRGHDVEEFVGVVRRYGTGDPDSSLSRLVKAARQRRVVSTLQLSQACGTCAGAA